MEVNLAKDFNCDNMGVGIGLRGIGEALGSSLRYPKDSVSFISSPILKDYSLLNSLNIVNPYKDGRLPIIIEALKVLTEDFSSKRFIGTNIGGPISTAASIRGTENLLKDTIKNKDKLHKLLKFCVACLLAYVEAVYKECGASISIADPIASADLLSLNQFKEFAEPYLIDLISGIKKITGSSPSLHICGKTNDRWNNIGNLDIKGFSLDNCEDLSAGKDFLGSKFSISGNVPPVEILRNGSVKDVLSSVKECILKGSDSPNGFILSPGCQIPVGTPLDNLIAYMYAARLYGRNATKGSICKGIMDLL